MDGFNISNERKVELFDGLFEFMISSTLSYGDDVELMLNYGFTDEEIKDYLLLNRFTDEVIDRMINNINRELEFDN